MRMRIAPPSEAVPIIMDAARSPVVGLDTEFADDVPVCRAPLHGLSLAGGSPADEVVGCFFPYQGHEVAPWAWLRDRVLVPLFGDPRRTIVLHPAKVDLQTLRRRGIPEEAIRARIECTMSMAHVYDENLPKGLKELGGCLLGVRGLESHAETQKRMTRLRRDGAKAVKACLKDIWEVYKEERKRSTEVEARIDPSWPSWRALAMRQPPKLTKGALEARVDPIVRSTIEADYEGRARAVFERYAALDAMLTLGVRYFFVGEIAAKRVPFYAPEVAANLPACLDIETRVCHPLTTEMEENGLKIDLPRLRDIKDAMEAALSALKADVVKAWGFAPDVEVDDSEEDEDSEGFNPGSTDQIVHIVWDVWKLRPPSWALSGGELNPKWVRAKDGMCRVNKEVLDWLASQDGPRSAEIRLLIEWRKFAKLMSGFVVPMDARASADPEHRLHPSTWPVGARTGRFSQSQPNCENIPRPSSMPKLPIPPGADPTKPPPGVNAEKDKKTGEVKGWRVGSLRAVFIPAPGWSIISLDLAQVENRLVAHESGDETMYDLFTLWDCYECKGSGRTTEPLHACPKCGAPDGKRDKLKPEQPAIKGFCLGKDIHSASGVALGLFDMYGPEEGRQRGKTFNHAASYGMGARTLARREKFNQKDAERGLEAWHARYPRVRELHARITGEIRERGYVQMWDGHVRRFYAARILERSNNLNHWEWEGIIREAVNVLAQGGTAAIMKRAMLATREKLRSHEDTNMRKVKLCNQIHDETLYEAPTLVAKDVLKLVAWELEHAANLRVPILAEGGIGPTWEKAHA